MVEVYILGRMVENTKDFTNLIRSMASGNIYGLMVGSMRESGLTGSKLIFLKINR